MKNTVLILIFSVLLISNSFGQKQQKLITGRWEVIDVTSESESAVLNMSFGFSERQFKEFFIPGFF